MSGLSLVSPTKPYCTVQTLKGIHLGLAEGEFLVLLCLTGCGTSTVLNIFAGLLKPRSGNVRVSAT